MDPYENSAKHTTVMKTDGLKQALNQYKFDAAFGGARRDEEKSRAKERIYSFRNKNHGWDPKNQRPELWNLYNAKVNKGESIRVFPISNWTELDVWQYIYLEKIPIVPLYFAAKRKVVEREGITIMVDDDRLELFPGETPVEKVVRFRTLGCYPLTGAVELDGRHAAANHSGNVAGHDFRTPRSTDRQRRRRHAKAKRRRIFLAEIRNETSKIRKRKATSIRDSNF